MDALYGKVGTCLTCGRVALLWQGKSRPHVRSAVSLHTASWVPKYVFFWSKNRRLSFLFCFWASNRPVFLSLSPTSAVVGSGVGHDRKLVHVRT